MKKLLTIIIATLMLIGGILGLSNNKVKAEDGSYVVKANGTSSGVDEIVLSVGENPAYCAEFKVDKFPGTNGETYQHRYNNANDYENNSQDGNEKQWWRDDENNWDKIRAVLYAGYPSNATGIDATYRDTADAVWYYTNAITPSSEKTQALISYAENNCSNVPSNVKLYFYTKDTDSYQWQSVFQLEQGSLEPKILNTTATGNGSKYSVTVNAGETLTIKDVVELGDLTVGTKYTIISKLIKGTETVQLTTSEITADRSTATVNVQFTAITPSDGDVYDIITILKQEDIEITTHNANKDVPDEKITVTVKEEEPSEVTIKISKTDLKGVEVEGAHIVVSGEGGFKEEWNSTTEPHELTLEPGSYKLEETVAPEGYKKVTTTIEFDVTKDGKITIKTTEVVNGEVEYDGEILILKDETAEEPDKPVDPEKPDEEKEDTTPEKESKKQPPSNSVNIPKTGVDD